VPRFEVRIFKDASGSAPFLEWIRALGRENIKAAAKVRTCVERLEEFGHDLRRPTSSPLRDKIHELRARTGKVHYRVLYFFDGRGRAVPAVGCTKEDEVEDADIDRAIACRSKYLENPERYTYREPSNVPIETVTKTRHQRGARD